MYEVLWSIHAKQMHCHYITSQPFFLVFFLGASDWTQALCTCKHTVTPNYIPSPYWAIWSKGKLKALQLSQDPDHLDLPLSLSLPGQEKTAQFPYLPRLPGPPKKKQLPLVPSELQLLSQEERLKSVSTTGQTVKCCCHLFWSQRESFTKHLFCEPLYIQVLWVHRKKRFTVALKYLIVPCPTEEEVYKFLDYAGPVDKSHSLNCDCDFLPFCTLINLYAFSKKRGKSKSIGEQFCRIKNSTLRFL